VVTDVGRLIKRCESRTGCDELLQRREVIAQTNLPARFLPSSIAT